MADWTLLEPLVVRMTGFPVAHLTKMRFRDTATHAQQLLACEEQIEHLHEQLLTISFKTAVSQAHDEEDTQAILSSLSTWRRAVGRYYPVTQTDLPVTFAWFQACLQKWNQLLDQRTGLQEKGKSIWQEELDAQREYLWQLAADPLVQEAIFLSSPSMYWALQRQGQQATLKKRKSATRKLERRFVTYLQRLCTKNETQSFFGPINYGRLDTAFAANLQISQADTPLRKREVFPSFWMAEAMATAMSGESNFRPYLKPRPHPYCLLENDKLTFPASGKEYLLSPMAATLFQLCNGSHTIIALADHLDETLEKAMAEIKQLEAANALVVRIIVPGDVSDPLAYLQTWLTTLPDTLSARDYWADILHEFQHAITAFATADLPQRIQLLAALEERFEEISTTASQRGGGAMYADRFLIFEECLGRLVSCEVGGLLAQTIQTQLKPILRLWYAYGRLRNQRDQQAAYTLWQTLATNDNQAIPFLTYLQALSRNSPMLPETADLNNFMAALRQLVQTKSDGHRACLCSAELPQPSLPPDADACDCCSVDLMIAADSLQALQAGEFQLVLGEGHSQPLPWVFPTAYFGEAEHISFEPLSATLTAQPGASLATQLAHTRKSKIFSYPLPGNLIELRPCYPDDRAIPIAAVQVREKEENWLALWANGQWLRVYPPLKRRATGLDPLAPFAFTAVEPLTIDLGEHTPRIEIDNIVYQREKWVLSTHPLQAWPERGFELFVQARRWQKEHQLPDEFFVRSPSEPKPLYIDLDNYFLIELLYALARQCETVTITEMLPNSQQLWLKTDAGLHCCEFRMLASVE